MKRHNFKKLQIWIDAINLISMSYKLTRTFPDFEKFGLVTQMNRCSVSIASNIAEGSSKRTDKHFSKYLDDSLGSAFEWETQLIVARNENYLNKETFNELSERVIKLQKMIVGFQKNLDD